MDFVWTSFGQMAAGLRYILGLETSCDETAAAVVGRDDTGTAVIASNLVLSQVKDHAPYGGVVPEIAARAHLHHLHRLAEAAMAQADLPYEALSGVAATAGPGLLGGLLVGLSMGKGIALAHGLPFSAVNHLEGHALTPRLLGACAFPYLMLLVSGGHTQFQLVRGVGNYKRLGTTIDDALGEAFDKTAKLLGLGYPGGPQVEVLALAGDDRRFVFPRPLKGRADCNFSFSGLKTAVRETVQSLSPLTDQDKADIAASFENAIVETMEDRVRRAFSSFRESFPDIAAPLFVVAGGVAANKRLRASLERSATEAGFGFFAPPAALCTDNAAMIAWAGAERLALGLADPLDFAARARWPLDTTSPAVYGSGKLGAKA